ncbi:hypothetical protein [Sphingomonas japonica]|uniref:Uncharacterized protein n=1 Tax=Sphingomonas japonica TaxID=511662 RepID=A0ABX0TZI6_9SPHN|nr:hypothetical protein [Sphingomonas japonica]NIJ22587.1 hypothetical protein [Sphingomonas japonica]
MLIPENCACASIPRDAGALSAFAALREGGDGSTPNAAVPTAVVVVIDSIIRVGRLKSLLSID